MAIMVSSLTLPLRTIRSGAPNGWSIGDRAAAHEIIRVTFALQQKNIDVLEAKFWAISTPGNVQYQQFMTRDEIHQLIAPSTAEKAPFMKWLHDGGVTDAMIEDYGDAIKVTVPVSIAEPLLATTFYHIHNAEESSSSSASVLIHAMNTAIVPSQFDSLVKMVVGLSQFPLPLKPKKEKRANIVENDWGVIPLTLHNLYNMQVPVMSSNVSIKHAKSNDRVSSQAVIGFVRQSYDDNDLQNWASQLGLTIPSLSPQHIIGDMPPHSPGHEGQLDIELIAGMNPQAENWYWFNERQTTWMYDWAVEFNGASLVDEPLVLSISYAWSERDSCNSQYFGDTCTQLGIDVHEYVRRTNIEFIKMGSRGITVISGSGDYGAMGSSDMYCRGDQTDPEFPASSPYVLSVGGTQLMQPEALPDPQYPLCQRLRFGQGKCASGGSGSVEHVANLDVSTIVSGGGFSNMTAQPSYQAQAVKNYLQSGVPLPPSYSFNSTGRAYPDIAAMAHNLLQWVWGSLAPTDGTSASTPIIAGIISGLNTISLRKSGKPLGFINPLLYQMAADDPTIFNDVTVGNNSCTEKGCFPSCKGFYATKGWDPITGLGTPNFAAMAKYIMNH